MQTYGVPEQQQLTAPSSLTAIFDFKWKSDAIVSPYLWRETIAACSFSFSAWVVPNTCQACREKKTQVTINSRVEIWIPYPVFSRVRSTVIVAQHRLSGTKSGIKLRATDASLTDRLPQRS